MNIHSVGAPQVSSPHNKQGIFHGKRAGKSSGVKPPPFQKGAAPGIFAFEQSAISHLKEIVNQAYEKLGVTNPASLDTSPEATASRIADFAIGMYSIYKRQNPDMEEGKRLEKYEKMIHKAIDKGFNEGVKILKGLNLFNGKVEKDANETMAIIQNKLNDFFTNAKNQLAATQ